MLTTGVGKMRDPGHEVVIDLLLGLLPVQEFPQKQHPDYGVAKCSRGKVCSEFFTQISRHFCAHFLCH